MAPRRRSTDDKMNWESPIFEKPRDFDPQTQDRFLPRDPYDFAIRVYHKEAWIWNTVDQAARQLYRHFLFRMPSMYFSRVAKVFYNAKIKGEDIGLLKAEGKVDPTPALRQFRVLWTEFVDTLIEEWKTLNVISALLLSAVLTIFQINSADTPIIRTSAFLSLSSAFMSLVFGCIYIIRFGTMKNKHKAVSFAEVMHRTNKAILWNVLVLLAIPAVWLAWSLLFFCVTILAFVWTDGNNSTPSTSNHVLLGSRIAITSLFGIGLMHFLLVVYTFRFQAPIPLSQPFPPEASEGLPDANAYTQQPTVDDIHNANDDWGFEDFNQEFTTGRNTTIASVLAREVVTALQNASDNGSRQSEVFPPTVVSPEPMNFASSPPRSPSPPRVVVIPPRSPEPPQPVRIIPMPPPRSPTPPRMNVMVPMIALADPPVIAIPGIPVVTPPTRLQRMDSGSSRPAPSPISPPSPGVYRSLSFTVPSRQASARRVANTGGNRNRGPQVVDVSGSASGNGNEPRPSPAMSRRTESEGSIRVDDPRAQFDDLPYVEERRPARLTRQRRS